MYYSVLKEIIKPSVRWYFQQSLKSKYEERRVRLAESFQDDGDLLAIDYIIENCGDGQLKEEFRRGQHDSTGNYPPCDEVAWLNAFSLTLPPVIEQILIIYLLLDAEHDWASAQASQAASEELQIRQIKHLEEMYQSIIRLPVALQFPRSIVNLATGLWGLDNARFDLAVRHLTAPGVDMECVIANRNVEKQQVSSDSMNSLVVGSLVVQGENKRAYLILQAFPQVYSEFKEIYRYMHIMLCCGQLMPALKFERMLRSRKDYPNIMHTFLQLCDENNEMDNLCKLTLDECEEDALARYHRTREIPLSQDATSDFEGSQSCRTPTKQTKSRQKKLTSVRSDNNRLVAPAVDTPAHRTRSKTRRQQRK